MGKILITGAGGFIGSHLVELLLHDGVPLKGIRLLLSQNQSTDLLPKKKFEIVRGDITDKKFVEKAVEGIETIYHLAGISITRDPKDKNNYSIYKKINVDGISNLLSACAKKKIQKFVFVSSVAVYGLPPWTPDVKNIDESHPKTYKEVYGRSKAEAEKKVIEAHKKWGLPYAIIRPANVYGPRSFGMIYTISKAIKNHQFNMIGSGKNTIDYLHVSDLVRGIRQAQLSKNTAGDYILAAKEKAQFKEMVKIISKNIKQKPSGIYIPRFFALPLGYALDICGKISGIQFPLSADRVKIMTMSQYYNIDKARKELGYNPTISLEKGIAMTCKWYRDNNHL